MADPGWAKLLELQTRPSLASAHRERQLGRELKNFLDGRGAVSTLSNDLNISDEDKRTVKLPGYLKKIIQSDAKAREFWPKLSFTHQKEYVREIEDAKKLETREKRIAAMMDALRKNQRKK